MQKKEEFVAMPSWTPEYVDTDSVVSSVPAVIYARYSCDKQTEQSIEGQLRECREYAEQHGLNVIGCYVDRALTGKNDSRAEFQRMIGESSSGLFKAIITYKTDRIARNRYDSAWYKRILRNNGIKLHYAKESVPDGPEGIILESLLEGMAEYYSAELSQKVHRGMRESALKCKVTGMPPLGYKASADKYYEIDEQAGAIVQMIFNMYENKTPSADICKHLNSIGAKTSYGKPFKLTSLNAILRNEKYTGVYKYADVRVEGGIPALVSKEQFCRVQNMLDLNRRTAAKGRKVEYLLCGKLYCGECGTGMHGESGRNKKGEKYCYYTCLKHKKYKSCDKRNVSKDWLEDLVAAETVRNILTPEQIEAIAKRCVALQEKERSDNIELIALNKRLDETQKSIENLMRAIEQGIITPKTKERLIQLEQEEAQLKLEIDSASVETPKLTEKHIKYLLSQFLREENVSDEKYNRDIIECFIHSVYLFDDKICIAYNLTEGDGVKKTELEFSRLEELYGSVSFGFGSPGWTRTNDNAINSRGLYRLSY